VGDKDSQREFSKFSNSISSGYNVFLAEVEDLLYRHSAINEAAVMGMSDSYRGRVQKHLSF
jgi:acyl-CoA synthetase (AMP-forming)/AMP-acid ligase II